MRVIRSAYDNGRDCHPFGCAVRRFGTHRAVESVVPRFIDICYIASAAKPKSPVKRETSQRDRFIGAARELEGDDDRDRFEKRLGKLAKAKPKGGRDEGEVTYRRDLEPQVKGAEDAILKIVREKVPRATLRRVGPLDFGNGPSWSCWVVTLTDNERDALARDAALLERLNAEAAKAGLAPDGFTMQSEETVARDFEGNWFYAMR